MLKGLTMETWNTKNTTHDRQMLKVQLVKSCGSRWIKVYFKVFGCVSGDADSCHDILDVGSFQLCKLNCSSPKASSLCEDVGALGTSGGCNTKHVFCAPLRTRLQWLQMYTAYRCIQYTTVLTCAHCIGLVSNMPFFNLIVASKPMYSDVCRNALKTKPSWGLHIERESAFSAMHFSPKKCWQASTIVAFGWCLHVCLPMPQHLAIPCFFPVGCLSERFRDSTTFSRWSVGHPQLSSQCGTSPINGYRWHL